MTADAQFCCILRGRDGFCEADRSDHRGVTRAGSAVKGSCKAFQAAGALRDTTQSRSHDPTAQPHR
jgi:hypothetical protein